MLVLFDFLHPDGRVLNMLSDVDPTRRFNDIVAEALADARAEWASDGIVHMTCRLPNQETPGPRPIGAILDPIVHRALALSSVEGPLKP